MRLWPIAALWITSTLAILGAEKRVQWLQVVFKPLTTLLFFAVIGWPGDDLRPLGHRRDRAVGDR